MRTTPRGVLGENTGARGGDSTGRKSEGNRKDLQQRQHALSTHLPGGRRGREAGAGGGRERGRRELPGRRGSKAGAGVGKDKFGWQEAQD